MKTILCTGLAGFIGTNFCEYIIPKYCNKYKFVSIDKLVEKYNINFVPTNHTFHIGDFTDKHFIDRIFKIEKPNIILHFGAESFVDSSTEDPSKFSHSNVFGTSILIEASIKYNIEKFFLISTDEVYGQLTSKNDSSWTELSLTKPRNNYSVSKLASELGVYAANSVHGLVYNISRCCNNFGKYQNQRSLVPKIITSLILDKEIPIHENAGNAIREWISPIDHIQAVMDILEKGQDNQIYNIGTGFECTNLEMVEYISKFMKITPKIKFVEGRKGLDYRYSIDCNKLKTHTGWIPQISFYECLQDTVFWYQDNIELFNLTDCRNPLPLDDE